MTVSSSIGPISGIDYGKLIDGLTGIDQRPIDLLNTQVQTIGQKSNTFNTLAAMMTSLKLSATSFTTSAIFRSTTATSSNTGVLSATSAIGAATGAYAFTVQRLATSSQIVSQGFSDQTRSMQDLGLISPTSALKQLGTPMNLADVNGGAGVAKGSIKITNGAGAATTVDLTRAVTIQDVVDSINGAGAGVTASVTNDRMVLTDTSGGGGNLTVAEAGAKTAQNLGILKSGTGSITGDDINRLNVNTTLASLNNGNGIRFASTGTDFSITSNSAVVFKVSLAGAATVGDVLAKINAAGKLGTTQMIAASLSSDGHSIVITDNGGGAQQTSITATTGSSAARDLGILKPATGNTITGDRLNVGLTSPLLRDLNNGNGFGTGSFTITNGNGVASTVNITSAQATVQDLLSAINTQASGVTAGLSSDKLGIALTDTTGGSGAFSVADATGTVAATLGLAQSVNGSSLVGTPAKLRTLVAGTLTFQLGKGRLDDVMKLTDLNGGKGVSRGTVRITDRSGASTLVDLSKAIDLNDVTNTINNTSGLNVVASLDGDHLVLTDQSGGSGTLNVANVGTTTTATDLGLTTPASNSNGVLRSGDLTKLNLSTNLDALNNGNGVRTFGSGVADLRVTYSGGSKDVSLTGAKTINDVLNALNTAGNVNGTQAFTASLSDHGLVIKDNASGGNVSVTALNTSSTARDLGLLGVDGSSGTLTGSRLNASADSALLRELNGGSGVRLGTIRIAKRTGGTTDVDLSGLSTVQDVISKINSTSGVGVTVSLNSAGTGLLLADTTGSATGVMAVTDVSGHAAADLGLAQSVNAASMTGSDLHLRYMSDNTSLAFLNGGSGFKAGKIMLTDAAGNSGTIDLTDSSITTLGQVIAKINANGTGIRASVNANGNGILLTDSSAGGTGTAKVAEVDGGTTAASLNILGSFTGNTLDGTLQKSINVLSTDTLQTLATKISQGNVGVSAAVISDGSSTAPYRLSLSSKSSGAAGRLVFNGAALGITSTTVTDGVDGAIVYGAGGSGLQATSSTNTYTGLVPSLTITANGVGAATVTVGRDDQKIVDAVKSFSDAYNKVVSNINDATKFDSKDPQNKGVLFGDATVESIQSALGGFISRIFNGVGPLKTLATAGVVVQQDGTVNFNEDKLRSTLSSNPDDLRNLFTTKTTGVGDTLSSVIDQFTNAQTGIIFHKTDSLQTQTTGLNKRITDLNTMLTAKKNRLVLQFANLEVSLAKLQQQGSALSSFSGTTTSTTKK